MRILASGPRASRTARARVGPSRPPSPWPSALPVSSSWPPRRGDRGIAMLAGCDGAPAWGDPRRRAPGRLRAGDLRRVLPERRELAPSLRPPDEEGLRSTRRERPHGDALRVKLQRAGVAVAPPAPRGCARGGGPLDAHPSPARTRALITCPSGEPGRLFKPGLLVESGRGAGSPTTEARAALGCTLRAACGRVCERHAVECAKVWVLALVVSRGSHSRWKEKTECGS